MRKALCFFTRKASRSHYLHSFVVLAIETGMRSGEMLALTLANVNFEKRTIFLPDTKNASPSTVPLSTRGLNAINVLLVNQWSAVLFWVSLHP